MLECSKIGCHEPAAWLPVLVFYADRRRWPKAPPARALCDLPICEGHQASMTLDYLLGTDGWMQSWMQIGAIFSLAGSAIPDPKETRVAFIALDSEEAKGFVSRRQKVL